MKVLIVGGGGREHALAKQIKDNPKIDTLYVAPGNGGISRDATCVDISATDIPRMVEFAVTEKIDFAIVAPDDPLVLGMVDALEEKGIPAFGPNKAAARIEGSKVFSKDLMRKYSIPTAEYQVFSDIEKAKEYLEEKNQFPIVIKADGLAAGKGVVIPETMEQADEFLSEIMEDKIFGESGNRVVIEEFLTGPEVSILAFVDGKTIIPMVSSMDHKTIYENNQGPNTGGMGTVAPNPHYTREIADLCMETIYLPTVKAMAAEGAPFKGCLFFGLMLTPTRPVVIEYNCRFGDPETQAVLPLLKTDLFEIMEAVVEERLDEIEILWEDAHCVCVIGASAGYPEQPKTGVSITGLQEDGQVDRDLVIYHAGTKKTSSGFETSGGRVLGVVAKDATLQGARDKAYAGIGNISFEGMQYRRDIGAH